MGSGDDYVAEYVDKVDVWFENTVALPFLPLIPKSITPNSITMFNLICKVASATLSIQAVVFFEVDKLEDSYRAIVSVALSAILAFVCMTLDYFDGMHARATKQCSVFGMVFDHWVDAFAIPCTSLLLQLAINGGLLGDLLVMLASAVFGCQLVLWSNSNPQVWLHPPIGGASAQFSVIGFMLATCVMEHYGYSRTGDAMLLLSSIVQISGLAGCIYNVYYLTNRMKSERKYIIGYLFVQFSIMFAYVMHNIHVIHETPQQRLSRGGSDHEFLNTHVYPIIDQWRPLLQNSKEDIIMRSMAPFSSHDPSAVHRWMSPIAFYLLSMVFGLHVNGGMCLFHAAKLPPKCCGAGLNWVMMLFALAIIALTFCHCDCCSIAYFPYAIFAYLLVVSVYEIVTVKAKYLDVPQDQKKQN